MKEELTKVPYKPVRSMDTRDKWGVNGSGGFLDFSLWFVYICMV
jgi:hypothetical protein